jgi:hypothetical protein
VSPRRRERTERRVTRREVLAAATAGGSLVLGGCTSGGSTRSDRTRSASPPSSTDTPSPSRTATERATPSATPFEDGRASPAPTCPDGYDPLRPRWVVEGPGPLGGFELSLARDTLERGATLTARLTNVTAETRTTGTEKKYDIQSRDGDDWYSVFGTEPEAFHTDEAVTHRPGDGFVWELPLTREGLTDAVDTGPTYAVCGPLEPGEYRFVYWGITSRKEVEAEYETEYALGVRFSVV